MGVGVGGGFVDGVGGHALVTGCGGGFGGFVRGFGGGFVFGGGIVGGGGVDVEERLGSG